MEITDAHNFLLEELYDLVHDEVCKVTDTYKYGDDVDYYKLKAKVCKNMTKTLQKFCNEDRN